MKMDMKKKEKDKILILKNKLSETLPYLQSL